MTANQIVGCVAIAAMLTLVLPRLIRSGERPARLFRMALFWMAIILVATAAAVFFTR